VKFYPRFVGDIMKKTSGLTMAQMGAYDRLTDWIYANEQAIDPEEIYIITHAQSPQDRRDVQRVLAKFFEADDRGFYSQQRVDETIAAALPKIQAARENGKKGGRPSKAKLAAIASIKEPNGLFPETHDEPGTKTNQSHIQSTTSVPDGTDADGVAPPPPAPGTDRVLITDPDEIIFGYGVPLLTVAGTSDKNARSFLGGLRKVHGDIALIDALRRCIREKPLQPLEWLAAALPPKPGKGKQSAVESRNAAVVDALIGDHA